MNTSTAKHITVHGRINGRNVTRAVLAEDFRDARRKAGLVGDGTVVDACAYSTADEIVCYRWPEPESISDLEALAAALADADAELQLALVAARQATGLTVAVVAERIGWSRERLREFESYWYDPSLSEVRRYALAIGARVGHTVNPAT